MTEHLTPAQRWCLQSLGDDADYSQLQSLGWSEELAGPVLHLEDGRRFVLDPCGRIVPE